MGDIRSGAGQGKRGWWEERGCRKEEDGGKVAERKHQNRKGGAHLKKQEKRVERVRGKQRAGREGVGMVWVRKKWYRQSLGEKGRWQAECGRERKVVGRVWERKEGGRQSVGEKGRW